MVYVEFCQVFFRLDVNRVAELRRVREMNGHILSSDHKTDGADLLLVGQYTIACESEKR